MPPLHESEPTLSRLVTEIAKLYSNSFAQRVEGLGLTHTQWQALSVISQNEGIKQAELAELLNIKPMSAGRLIDRMESAGWVARERSTSDRRVIHLHLTPAVAPLLTVMKKAARQTRNNALQGFDDNEQELLLTMLLRVKANLSSSAEKPRTKTNRHKTQ